MNRVRESWNRRLKQEEGREYKGGVMGRKAITKCHVKAHMETYYSRSFLKIYAHKKKSNWNAQIRGEKEPTRHLLPPRETSKASARNRLYLIDSLANRSRLKPRIMQPMGKALGSPQTGGKT